MYDCVIYNQNYIFEVDIFREVVKKYITKISFFYVFHFLVTPDTSNIEVTTLNEIERVDISLLNGQTLKMKVSSVESTNRFHVQLPSALKCEHIVDKYMADKNAEVISINASQLAANHTLSCKIRY